MLRTRIAGTVVLAALALTASAGAHQAATPTRIISLSPSSTEDLFAIGAGKQVVAVDDQSNYPASAPHTKLSGYTPNVEAIAAYHPDLVVVSADLGGVVGALGKLKIPVLVDPPASGLAGAYAQIAQLGKVTGHEAGAATVITRMKSRIAQAVASVPKGSHLTFYEELSPDYYSVTSKTFGGKALALLGLHDIADPADKSGSGYPQLSGEYIVAQDPDLIVLADTRCCGQTAATVAARPGWNTISAVKSGGVIAVSDDIASRWGPRIADFLTAVAAGVRKADAAKG